MPKGGWETTPRGSPPVRDSRFSDSGYSVFGTPETRCRDTRCGYPGTLCFGYVLLVEERTRCTTSLDSVKHHVHYLVIL